MMIRLKCKGCGRLLRLYKEDFKSDNSFVCRVCGETTTVPEDGIDLQYARLEKYVATGATPEHNIHMPTSSKILHFSAPLPVLMLAASSQKHGLEFRYVRVNKIVEAYMLTKLHDDDSMSAKVFVPVDDLSDEEKRVAIKDVSEELFLYYRNNKHYESKKLEWDDGVAELFFIVPRQEENCRNYFVYQYFNKKYNYHVEIYGDSVDLMEMVAEDLETGNKVFKQLAANMKSTE